MSKKKRTQKGSPKSNKEKPEEEIDMSEYEDSYDGEYEGEPTDKVDEDEIDYDEYELPEDFELPDREVLGWSRYSERTMPFPSPCQRILSP